MAKRGIRVSTAVTLLVFGGALLAALPLQWAWWRTAERTSLQLVDTLGEQIASTVRREWWEKVVAIEAAHDVASSLLGAAPDAEAVRRALVAALTATPVPSSAAYETAAERVTATRGPDNRIVLDAEAAAPMTGPVERGWREEPPAAGRRGAVSYLGAVGGALSVAMDSERIAELLGSIPAGRTGGAFMVDARGQVRATPTGDAHRALAGAAAAAGAVVATRPAQAVNVVETRRLVVGADAYRAYFSPLEFRGWQFVVIVPEAEFLGEIQETMRRTLLALLALAVVLGLGAALAAQKVLAGPVSGLTADLRRIERFELEDIAYRPGRLREFDQLSGAIARMAKGLADFAKFIPTDLVRTLLAEGVRAAPGGETRRLTVLFADVAGFTQLSERMGTAVIDVVSAYLDLVSSQVEASGGTVDKFIGDAVMAFWGAPRPDPEQARNACVAALAALDALSAAGLKDDRGAPLRIRIGIHSGPAVVGNIGSARRLNYTAIGDTVNLASRLEGANKVFGTAILISQATRDAIGDDFLTREVAEVAVVGKARSVRVHELLPARASRPRPPWLDDYDGALGAYRARDFAHAIALLDHALAERPEDGPSAWLKARCEELLAAPPPADWTGVAMLDRK